MLKEILNGEVTIKRGVLISLIAALVLSMSMTGYLLIMWNYGENVVIKKSDDEMEITFGKEHEDKTEDTEKIKVYVVGEVKNPSVVTLEKGQIIEDAVLLAGGFTENADMENINLAYVLTENVMLQIRSKKQSSENTDGLENDEASGNTGMPENKDVLKNSNTPGNENVSKNSNAPGNEAASKTTPEKEVSDPLFPGMNIVTDSGGAVVGESANNVSIKININSASKEQLTTLPGIGPAIADNIIAFRQENGRFEKIEDIMNVSGIGDAKFRKLKDLITVE